MSIPLVLRATSAKGNIEYHLEFDPVWDGLDSFVEYLKKHWNAEVIEATDGIYSRRWVVRINDIPISIYHDSQMGNYFVREDGCPDQDLLEKIESDLIRRMS